MKAKTLHMNEVNDLHNASLYISFFGLKAQLIIAQGITLGTLSPHGLRPERAAQYIDSVALTGCRKHGINIPRAMPWANMSWAYSPNEISNRDH